jgi:hypothetical protein
LIPDIPYPFGFIAQAPEDAIDIGSAKKAIKIVCATTHTCVLMNDYSLKCWGGNDQGQLGYGDTVKRGDNFLSMGDFLPEVDLWYVPPPTPPPTQMPTPSPTTMPTPAPTQMPTPAPTPMPTASPTPNQTAAPTRAPTPAQT